MSGRSRRVLIVEDEQLVSALLEQTLESVDFVTSRANNAVEAKRQIEAFDPDIALLDIDEIQAQAILDMRLQRLTGLELEPYVVRVRAAVAAKSPENPR